MVDDSHRGYLMELLATKLLSLQGNVQIIGMSATLSVCNVALIGDHLLTEQEHGVDSYMAECKTLHLEIPANPR